MPSQLTINQVFTSFYVPFIGQTIPHLGAAITFLGVSIPDFGKAVSDIGIPKSYSWYSFLLLV